MWQYIFTKIDFIILVYNHLLRNLRSMQISLFLFSAYHVFNQTNSTYSPFVFNKQYQAPTTNYTFNFVVSNSVNAPATAMASNTNSDNDMITNTAMNAGGKKRRKRMVSAILENPTVAELPHPISPSRVISNSSSSDITYSANKYRLIESGRSFLFGLIPLVT